MTPRNPSKLGSIPQQRFGSPQDTGCTLFSTDITIVEPLLSFAQRTRTWQFEGFCVFALQIVIAIGPVPICVCRGGGTSHAKLPPPPPALYMEMRYLGGGWRGGEREW